MQEWHTNNLIYIIISGSEKELVYTGALFQSLYLNMQGISIEDQARDDYGNHSPTKDLIQDIGRIIPCAGDRRYMEWRSKRRGKGLRDFTTPPKPLELDILEDVAVT